MKPRDRHSSRGLNSPVDNSGPCELGTYAGEVRWDDLFDDLASELQGGLDAEAGRRAIEDERLRVGRLTVRERLIALAESGERPVSLQMSDGSIVAVRPKAFGSDWLSAELLAESGRARVCIVPTAGIASLVLDAEQLVASLREPLGSRPGDLSGRLGLSFALRTSPSAVRVRRHHRDDRRHDRPSCSRPRGRGRSRARCGQACEGRRRLPDHSALGPSPRDSRRRLTGQRRLSAQTSSTSGNETMSAHETMNAHEIMNAQETTRAEGGAAGSRRPGLLPRTGSRQCPRTRSGGARRLGAGTRTGRRCTARAWFARLAIRRLHRCE